PWTAATPHGDGNRRGWAPGACSRACRSSNTVCEIRKADMAEPHPGRAGMARPLAVRATPSPREGRALAVCAADTTSAPSARRLRHSPLRERGEQPSGVAVAVAPQTQVDARAGDGGGE